MPQRNTITQEQRLNILVETGKLESLIRALYSGTTELTKENYAKLLECINNIEWEVSKP